MSGFSKERNTDISEKIIYEILLRSFTEEGTIKAATLRLKHIADLGVDIVYLAPFCEMDDCEDRSAWSARQIASGMNNPKNPYRISDYFKIDSEYGTDSDLKAFMDEAHSLGMKVLFDLVYMHCGPTKFVLEHPAFLKRDDNGNIICSKYNFPLLDYGNPELCEYMWSNMIYWVEKFDVDGYRCDVGDKVPLFFWKEGKKRIEEIKSPVYMINEGEDPYYMQEVFDVSFHNHRFSWNDVIDKALRSGKTGIHHSIRMIYEALKARNPDGALLLRAYENHDFVVDSLGDRLDAKYPDVIEALLVLNFTIDGVPMLYSGNEFADSRRHTMWRWSGDEYCIDWGVLDSELGQKRLELVKKLCALRHSLQALSYGVTEIQKEADTLVFTRRYGNEIVRATFRFEAPEVSCPAPVGEVLLIGNAREGDGGYILGAGGYIVELINKEKKYE